MAIKGRITEFWVVGPERESASKYTVKTLYNLFRGTEPHDVDDYQIFEDEKSALDFIKLCKVRSRIALKLGDLTTEELGYVDDAITRTIESLREGK